MEWILLLAAIITEVAGTSLLKLSDGMRNLWPTLGSLALYLASLALLGLSLNKLDVSVAYAIWSGLGTALIVLIGIFFLGEAASWQKLLFISLIVIGAIGLNLTGEGH
ncbi:multidrug efflux SMR transporter [Anaerolineae bacterium CFX7]|nr:multidrug efflux SMR transporter [Anaerolineae bacterium CFX7]